MRKKSTVLSSMAIGLLVIVNVLLTFFCSGDIPVYGTIKQDVHKVYKYSGTGTMKVDIDKNKIKEITGFPEGQGGQNFIDMLKKEAASMDMGIELEGTRLGMEEISSIRILSNSQVQYENKFYTDGGQVWVYNSDSTSPGGWAKMDLPEGINSIPPFMDIESLAKLKDSIKLVSQDGMSKTFQIEVNSDNEKLLFGKSEGKMSIPFDFIDKYNGSIDNMNMIINLKTCERVDTITPDTRLASLNLSFMLPFKDITASSSSVWKPQLDPEEQKLYNSFYLNISLNVNFFYDDVQVQKPS